MVLFLVGLGLGDHRDITVRGLEAVKSCKSIYLEYYTSILGVDKAKLEEFYGHEVILADREFVESQAETMFLEAKEENIAMLVVGDPLCATTHVDLMLRVKSVGIPVEVIHNASVMAAVASCGLPLYQFGYTVSIPFFEENWQPDSFYDRIQYNTKGDMHTLCLVDIKVKEPNYQASSSYKALTYLPPRFMTVNQAIEQLEIVEQKRQEKVILPSTKVVGMARLGQPSRYILYGTVEELREMDFGPPLHCLVICGQLHPLEEEILETFRVKEDSPRRVAVNAGEVEEEESEDIL